VGAEQFASGDWRCRSLEACQRRAARKGLPGRAADASGQLF
jgi:hypothetical protein